MVSLPREPAPPLIELRDPTRLEVDLLHQLQRVLLIHPVACQAAFTALVAEGRRFAETDEGRVWRDRLIGSALLREVRLTFDLSTLGLLEEEAGAALPSSYLDALFMIASGGDTDAVLNQAFWNGIEGRPDGRTGD
jgi:hypothetical protein